jgi:predicted phosphoribosyltransferase
VILVDDGLATGSTMRAAVQAIKRKHPARIIVAVPTAAPSTCEEFQTIADACICTITPEPFRAVGLWYEDFEQINDQEVCELLARSIPEPQGEEAASVSPLVAAVDPDRAASR